MGAQIVQEAALVGRQEELESAGQALEGRSGGVMVVGEPGVGKTELARAVLAGLSAADEPEILWLVASGSEPSIPFGVFAPYVPDIGGIPGRQPDPFFLLQTLRRAVLERAHGQDLIIGVDDAHRLDGHSATLVYQLVAAREARVVISMRSGAGGPAALRSLWKEELVERIDLDPLGPDATAELARRLLEGGPLGGELQEALWQISRGNPLFLRELVLTGRRAGTITAHEGLWRLEGDLAVGPRLAELVMERLGSTGPDELASLEVFAFAGPLPVTVAERAAPAEHLARLLRDGLLVSERSGREVTVRVGHPLVAEALREGMPAVRAPQLARLMAGAFEADGRLQEELLRVVTWRLEGRQAVPADLLLQAALQAAERQHWPLSARLAEAAVDGGAGTEAVFALADAHRALGQFAAALEVMGSQEGHGDDQVARGAVLRAYILSVGLGRFDQADRVLERTALRISDRSARTWVDAVRAGLLSFAGRPAETVARCRPLMGHPDLTPRADLMVRAALALGRAWCGHTEDALRILADAPTTGPSTSGWLPASWIKLTQVLALGQSGQVGRMDALATDDYRLGVQLNNRHIQGRAAGELGWAALMRGDLVQAVSRFREATDVFGPDDLPGSHAHTQIGLAEVLAETGDLGGAGTALASARPVAERSAALNPRWEIAAARMEAAEGAVGDALRRLDRAAHLARDAGLAGYEIMALHAAVRLGSAAPARRLSQLEPTVGNGLLATIAAHARALGTGSGAGDLLDRVAETYAGRELRLYAAEAAAQACQAHRRAGNRRRATASASRAHFLLGAPTGPRPLALSVAMTPPELTRREGEVARLAARGLSSSSIADRLCLSVRTVETHLARVYFKLGIGSRAELTSALLPERFAGRHVEAG